MRMNRISLFTIAVVGTLLASHAPVQGYVLSSSRWPLGSNVTMQLELGGFSGTLIDGSTGGWGSIAESALTEWNGKMNQLKFSVVRDSAAALAGGNNLNNVFWGSTVYGQAFGTRTLAITTFWYMGSTRTESDVVFNTNQSWNSYRGSLRTASSGDVLNDFRRVALHEFGHVVGLEHPDDSGQSVVAQMNSTISDLDDLAADDIAGAQALYGAPAVAASKAVIGTPQPGSTLSSPDVTFGWKLVSSASSYWMYVGSSPGRADYFNSGSLANTISSKRATGLPSDGRTICVRMLTNQQGTWYFNDYTYTALRSVSAVMLHPVPSTTVASPVVFQWRAGIGATAYRLAVGSALGKNDICDSGTLSAASRSVTIAPKRIPVLYVRLWTFAGGVWYYRDYGYRM